MGTFKGQHNDILREFCGENNCNVVITTHNLTNKFQPLDLSVNKAAKSSIQNKYNNWFPDQVSTQLQIANDPTNVIIDIIRWLLYHRNYQI